MTIKEMSKSYNLESAKKALKSVQSKKCRFKKQKAREDYKSTMATILQDEQNLKEIIQYLSPKRQFVTTMTNVDIDLLNYDETVRAIKSIQSKICLSQHYEDKVQFNEAIKIQDMLLEHKKNTKPIEETVVKKSTLNNLIRHLQDQDQEIDKDYLINLIQEIIDETTKF